MKHKPKNGRVLITPIIEEEKTEAGLFVIEKNSSRKLAKGKVVKFDESLKAQDGSPLLADGETVWYRNGIGFDITIGGTAYLLVKATELEMVLGE